MTWLRQILFRLRPFFSRKKIEATMTEEIRAHLEMLTEANIAAGMSPEEARAAARREFGGVDQVKEAWRDERTIVWLEQTLKEFRYAARSLAKSPSYALAVVATLAIGIGATTAVVSYAWPIVFPRIPYAQPERMVVLTDPDATGSRPGMPFPLFSYSYRFALVRDNTKSFVALGAVRPDQLNLVVRGDPTAAQVGWVMDDYLNMLTPAPLHGRLFDPEDFRSDSGNVAVVSWEAWQKRFNADPGLVGQDIQLGGRIRRVIGILPKTFHPPPEFTSADIYLSEAPKMAFAPLPYQWIQVIAQLKPGVTLAQARAELALVQSPNKDANFLNVIKAQIIPIAAYYQKNETTSIHWVFLGAVAFVYIIACSNAASLMLARAVARRRELGVRLAIGGSRWQVIRLLLTESISLATLSGLVGILIVRWGLWALAWQQTKDTIAAETASILNLPMLATIAAMSLLTSALVVAIPALRISRAPVSEALKESAGSTGDGWRLQRMRSGLVAMQAALAVVLLTGAGLMLRSFWRLEQINLGFDPEDKLAVMGVLPEGVPQDSALGLVTRFREELARLPGVIAVTYAGIIPFGNFGYVLPAKIETRPELGEIRFSFNRVSPEYFTTMGLPLVFGRGFTSLHPGDPPVAIINQSAARRYFGGFGALGRRLDLGRDGKWEIIGVVGDVREPRRSDDVGPQAYCPFWQPPVYAGSFAELVRLAGTPPAGLEAMIRRAAYAADQHLVVNILPLAVGVERDIQTEHYAMVTLEVLSALALVLAATGLFAVMAYIVAQRQREFSVRIALGAAPGDLLRLVLRRGLLPASAGVGVGLAAALGLTRFLQSVLYETSPYDPVTYLGVAAVLLTVATVACWLPASRATKVDPVIVLRAE